MLIKSLNSKRRRLTGACRQLTSSVLGAKGARGEEGAALVEIAISAVILLAMLFGIIEFSLAFYTYNYVSDAARDGTRWAIVRGAQCLSLDHCNATTTDISNYVKSIQYPGIDSAKMTVTANWYTQSGATPRTWSLCDPAATTCNVSGNQVRVTVTYAFPLSVPFWRVTTLNVSSTSSMVVSL